VNSKNYIDNSEYLETKPFDDQSKREMADKKKKD